MLKDRIRQSLGVYSDSFDDVEITQAIDDVSLRTPPIPDRDTILMYGVMAKLMARLFPTGQNGPFWQELYLDNIELPR